MPKTVINDLAINVEARGHRHSILLWPKLWNEWNPPIQLRWKGKKFSKSSQNNIPNKSGVYAFVIQPGITIGLPISVLMYIGQTDRPLRQRFGEYLHEMKNPTGRPAISTLLQMYTSKHLFFYCAIVRSPSLPRDIETLLLESLVPPMNRKYPAKISRIVRAFS